VSSDSESGLSHYQLYIDGSLDTNNISGTSIVPVNSLSCGNHTWFVKAIDNAGNSTNSNTFNLTISCGSGFIPPTPPIIPISQNQTFEITVLDDQAMINLSNIENVYQIAISITPDFEYVSWELYEEKMILPDAEKVYLKFRSETGGVSEVYEVETQTNSSNAPSILNGSLIRAFNNFKVYIINNNYIRHILDGEIFNFYGHLNRDNIQEVNSSQLNNYQESFLIRADNDYKVYEIRDKKKYWLNMTVEEFVNLGYSWREVYVVNEGELGWYETGKQMESK